MAKADHILFGGPILTMDPAYPRAEALAIAKGRILAVGTLPEIEALSGAHTVRENLRGAALMPGLIESHTHALWGGCRDLFQVYTGYQATVPQLAEAVRTRAARLPKGAWISGGPWRYDMSAEIAQSPRAWLDQLAPHHPVALSDTTQHALWCNSKALDAAGLSDSTAEISGGVMGRSASGALSGFLAEAACAPVMRHLPWSAEQLDQACDYAVRYFNSLGYTGFKEPSADPADLAAYARAHDQGRLHLHAAAHLTVFSPLSSDLIPLARLNDLRATYRRPGLGLDFSKLFLDGVAPAYTASFLAPYLARPGYDPATHSPDATLLLAPEHLAQIVIEHDAAGFCVKMHAVGDNAARKGLDAIAAARAANGPNGPRHEIAHCTFISDTDLPRFAALNAVAEVSPKLWMPNAATSAQVAALGAARLAQVHRIRALLAAGAEVIFGTDWPASAPDANPWSGLAGMISRRDPSRAYPGSVAPDEAISLAEALPLFTRNAARAMGLAGQTGQLKPGLWADYILLETDPFSQSNAALFATCVARTVFKGQTVYEARG